MKDNYPPSTASPLSLTPTPSIRKDNSESGLFGKSGRYKLWVLAAILLLAFWSMLTGSVNLKWSAGNLARLSDQFDFTNLEDLDILVRTQRNATPATLFMYKFCTFLFSLVCQRVRIEVGLFCFGVCVCVVCELKGSGGAREGGEAHVGFVHP